MGRGFLLLLWLVIQPAVSRMLVATEPRNKWVTETTAGRFKIHCDFRLDPHESLTADLSNLASEVTQLLELPVSHEPIHVVLFSSPTEYGRYIKKYFPTLPDRRALFIQYRGPGMLFAHWHADVRTDIRHEVVHGLLNARNRPLPLWLDEGLAEYFEVASNERLAGNPHLTKVCEEIKLERVPDLASLEQLSQIEQLGNDQYRDSWAWVHFLLHRNQQTRSFLVRHLAAHLGQSPAIPLSRAIANELPAWRTQFLSHFQAIHTKQQLQATPQLAAD